MLQAFSYEEICRRLSTRFQQLHQAGRTESIRLVGLLFASPGSPVGKDDILPRLDDYHHRSGDNVDFFCAGYGAYWPPGWAQDQETVARTTDPLSGRTTQWMYSAKFANDLHKQVQQLAPGLKFSGEADLLLTNAVFDTAGRHAKLEFTTTIVLRLQRLKSDAALTTVPELLERIFAYAADQDLQNPASEFSDRQALRVGRAWLEETFAEKLPMSLGKVWSRGKHYAVHDLTT
jgi:hypothetical protein